MRKLLSLAAVALLGFTPYLSTPPSSGSGGSGVGGSLGSADNRAIRTDGTAGTTAQGSDVMIDDSANVTANGYLCYAGGNQSGDEKCQLAGGAGGTLFSADSDLRWYNDADISSGSADVAVSRSAANILGLTNASTGGGALELTEMSAPTAPAANKARLFTQDNGAGKTQLVVRFPTGAVQVIATEP